MHIRQLMPDPSPPPAPRRYSASQLPPDADPAEKEFVGLLAKALAPSYMLIRRLGAGGMGTVYVARDPVLKRLVAVKVMSPELSRDPDARSRFSREAQAVAAISHPNVVAVYAVGELENGLPYIVMQYVEGRSMAERIDEDGPLDVAAAKRVLGEVASALAATHKKGIIHRDIKPANILWDEEAGRALVTDFGIAAVEEVLRSAQDDSEYKKLTGTGMIVGTPAYMSPEQFLNEPITDKTDIYALGLLGYELIAGEGPYNVRSPAELMAAHLRDVPRNLGTLKTNVDAEIEGLMTACLDKDPLKRPTAQYISDHLTRGVGALLEWPPPGLGNFASRYNQLLLALTLGGYLIGVPLLGISTMDLDDALRQAMPSPGALVVLTSFGALSLLVGAVSLARLFMDARRAVRRGYGWLTVAEAACDDRGDTGALITGGREYAALSPSQRNSMRRRRLGAGATRMAGALTPIVGFVFGLLFAARFGAGAGMLVFISLWLGLALLLIARVATWREDWVLHKSRVRLETARKARADESRLGESWTATFDSVRSGQKLGAGIPKGVLRHAYAQYAVAGLVFAVVGSVCTLAYAMVAIGSAIEVEFNSYGSNIGTNSLDRLRKIQRLERLRLPVDTTMSPLAAGKLMQSFTGSDGLLWVAAAEERYVRDARRLSAGARDTLRRAADNAQLPEFRRFARARTYDYYGALMPLGKLDSLNLWEVPIMKFAPVRRLATAAFAAGVLAMADGKNAEAELRFRELLSVGFLMIEEGQYLIDALVGRILVLKARTGLAGLYQQTGRSVEASFVSEASDPADGIVLARQLQLDQRQTRISALRVLSDTSMFRGMRMELLNFPLSFGPCGDLKQVVFGVDTSYTTALVAARKDLVRFPSDSVLFDKITHALDRPMRDGFGDGGWDYKLLAPIAWAVDFLTGTKRMQSCVSMLS